MVTGLTNSSAAKLSAATSPPSAYPTETVANIKGTGMAGIIKLMRSMHLAAEPLLSPSAAALLTKRILAGSWYPEKDFLELVAVLVRLGKGLSWERLGRAAAETDLNTVYRSLVKKGDLDVTLARAEVVWRNYHDTGRIEASRVGANIARIQVTGYAMISAEMCQLNTGFFSGLVAASGVTVGAVTKPSCTAKKDRACIWDIEYRTA